MRSFHFFILIFWFFGCGTEKESNIRNIEFTYYDNGQPKFKTTYYKDDITATKELFYTSGKLRNRFTYVEGNLEGNYYFYHPNGTVYSVTPYKLGLKNGWQEKFDEKGKLLSRQLYRDDQPGQLIEFDRKGKERIQPRLLFEKLDKIKAPYQQGYRFFLSGSVKNVSFYFGKLEDGEFFKDDLVELRNSEFLDPGLGGVKTELKEFEGRIYFTGTGMESASSFNLVAKAETSVSNFLVIETEVNIKMQ
jgi:hypothetical protein